MPATAAWLASGEAALNRCIAGSSQAAATAQRLQGTSLQVDIEGIARIRAEVRDGRVALLSGDDTPADAVISGSPPALLQLFKGGVSRGANAASQTSAQIRGDAEVANLYRELFRLARPDPEEELSRWVGDLPARKIAQAAQGVLSWARRARRTAGENVAEYLQEESRDLVGRTEVDEFLHEVDGLRETADRIEARLARLEQRLTGKKTA
jgi:ubiquinone biosynthesis protein UbiJ